MYFTDITEETARMKKGQEAGRINERGKADMQKMMVKQGLKR